jgi:hypothetical protein
MFIFSEHGRQLIAVEVNLPLAICLWSIGSSDLSVILVMAHPHKAVSLMS